MAPDVTTWVAANQRHLAASVARVRQRVERYLAADPDAGAWHDRLRAADEELGAAEGAMPAAPALDVLCATFSLSAFERDVLLLAAGPDLDGAFATGFAGWRPPESSPTFGLALAALDEPHWSAVTPGAPLRAWRLIELGPGPGPTSSPLRIDERILHYLAGIDGLDERLEGTLLPVGMQPPLPPSHLMLADELVRLWTAADRTPPIIQLCGPDRLAKIGVAAATCRAIGIPLYTLRTDALPAGPAELEALRRLCEREFALTGGAVLIDSDPAEGGPDAAALALVARMADRLSAPVIIATREPIVGVDRAAVRIDVRKPAPTEQHAIWLSSLGSLADRANGAIDALVGQFDLGTRAIEAAGAVARAAPSPERERDIARILWDASRTQARPRLDDLAQRIEPAATWDDLVLPDAQRRTLREILAHARHRSRVYRDWGFASKGARGLGVSVLFSGPSGTGKTMAAEVLAGELRLDLYRIDLSSVVSKYIGETEKNLRRVFDAAEDGGTILLFDEADALFGKRSEVKDSHDRYANIEVGYLLQRMEAYRGLAILTTNLKSALDVAFVRRLRFIVQFPFPDPMARAEIWRRIFPDATPVEGLEPETLARLNVAGGSIRNIALGAAFLAADAGQPVRMTHLIQAARGEYQKLEKPLTDTEIGGPR